MGNSINPETVIIEDRPSEWGEISDEAIEFLKTDDGILSSIQREVLDRIVANQWFLVRNELKAGSPYGVQTYLTLGGIELPFNGITNLVLVLQSYDMETQAQLISAMKPGTIEPITEERARKNIARIQAKGYLIYPSLV